MAAIDPENLGYKVTTRNISYEQMVREAWGTDWGKRDVVYMFSNGTTRLDSDNAKSGIYGLGIVSGMCPDPGIIYDGLQIRLLADGSNGLVGIENPTYVTSPNRGMMADNNFTRESVVLTEQGNRIIANY